MSKRNEDELILGGQEIEKLSGDSEKYHMLIKSILAGHRRAVKALTTVCIACVVTTLITISVMVGGTLYLVSNFEMAVEETITYEQESDGNSSIINGDNYNDNSSNNKGNK